MQYEREEKMKYTVKTNNQIITDTDDFKTAVFSYAREIGNITEISDADKLYEHNVILCLKEEMRCIGVSLFCCTMGTIN